MNIKRLLFGALLASSFSAMAAGGDAPRYVFYFIGDGMGMGPVMTAQAYNRDILRNDKPLTMMQFPVVSWCMTYSASHSITDSAAAGTALSTGHKTRNGMLGMDADTIPVRSIASRLHDDGWGVGLVTTVSPDDATPGAFYAHVPARRQTYDIGRQAAESGYEFLSGSTWRGAVDRKGNPTDLMDYLRSYPGIDVVHDIASARATDSTRVFLTMLNPFNDSNVGFTIDSLPGALTLPGMTAACIDHLSRVSPDRFFIMVEGGNIDHVGHGNDAASVIREVLNFDQTLGLALDFYRSHPDETVIIVTADHETGGLSIGNRTTGYNSYPGLLTSQRMSKDRYSRELSRLMGNGEPLSWDGFRAFTTLNTGLWDAVSVTDEQEASLRRLYDATLAGSTDDQKTLYATFSALTAEVFKILNDNAGFGWTTTGHSGNPVPVYAIGRGMEGVTTLRDNTDVAPFLLRLVYPEANE